MIFTTYRPAGMGRAACRGVQGAGTPSQEIGLLKVMTVGCAGL